MQVTVTEIGNILTRTSGFLRTVSSHSVQPYRGCAFGNALCGVGCYVRHNGHVTRGRAWGSFLEVRANAAASYRAGVARERRWARRTRGVFSIFLSSSTEPFLPQEARYGVTRGLLCAMVEEPPDLLILQTHSHLVTACLDLCRELRWRCRLRVHLSIETDIEQFPGLPPHASSVERRLKAARTLHEAGIETVVTVAPLLPHARSRALLRPRGGVRLGGGDRPLHRRRRHGRRRPHPAHPPAAGNGPRWIPAPSAWPIATAWCASPSATCPAAWASTSTASPPATSDSRSLEHGYRFVMVIRGSKPVKSSGFRVHRGIS